MLQRPRLPASRLVAGTLGLVLAAAVWGQVGPAEHILKDRARSLTNTATQRNVNPSYAPPPKTTPAPKPAVAQPVAQIPELTGAQVTAARQLRKDLNAIEAKPDAVSAHAETLTQDLLKTAAGAKQPDLNHLMALAADLAAGWPAQKLTDAEKDQMANSLVRLLNCHDQPAATTQKIYQNTEALLKRSGMADADSRRIASGLKTIVTQLQR
jgi:hypothetical protein